MGLAGVPSSDAWNLWGNITRLVQEDAKRGFGSKVAIDLNNIKQHAKAAHAPRERIAVVITFDATNDVAQEVGAYMQQRWNELLDDGKRVFREARLHGLR
jgi:hypothetical protein